MDEDILEWITAPNVAPGLTARVIDITPDMAMKMLARNDSNRTIKSTKLAQLEADLRSGAWVLNGETIILSDDFRLNDGQHRLSAIVNTGITVPSLVVFGAPRSSRLSLDQGAARGAQDYLTMEGNHYAVAAASMCRNLIGYENAGGKSFGIPSSVTNTQIMERYHNDPFIAEAAEFASRGKYKAKSLLAPAVIGFCYYVFAKINKAAAQDYLTQILEGQMLRKGDPAFAVRAQLMNLGKSSRQARAELVMRGWVYYRQGKPLLLAKVFGSFPEIE